MILTLYFNDILLEGKDIEMLNETKVRSLVLK